MKGRVCLGQMILITAVFIGLFIHETAFATKQIEVGVHEKWVDAKVENATLEQVLAALGKPLGFTAHIDPSLSSKLVTETFTAVPVDRVLDRLLRGMNYALSGSSLYVWAREVSATSPQTSPEEWPVAASEEPSEEVEEEEVDFATIETWKAKLESAIDPEVRLTALEDILAYSWEEEETQIVPSLVTALQDEEPEVRTLALEGLYGIEDSESQGTIRDAIVKMAESDPVSEHRVQALVWLTERNPEDAKALLQNTLTDSDPDIRAFAEGLLEEFQAFAEEYPE
jgi:hypothetical protein